MSKGWQAVVDRLDLILGRLPKPEPKPEPGILDPDLDGEIVYVDVCFARPGVTCFCRRCTSRHEVRGL